MRHVVHCSGYNLAERIDRPETKNRRGEIVSGKFFDWDAVCLGDPNRGILGRIPMAIRVAETLQAECLIWSTGATYISGRSEAEVMMESAIGLLESKSGAVDWLKSISILEQESENTFSSLQFAAKLVFARFKASETMLHLVTSDNHAPRVARDAALCFNDQRNVILSVVPAHTSYGGSSPSGTIIQELRSKCRIP